VSTIEIIAVVFSLLCVALSVRRKVLNWPAGIIGVCAYAGLFYREKLYADLVLQGFFFVQGIYGWTMWKKSEKTDSDILIDSLSTHERFVHAFAILLITSTWAYALMKFTDASMPFVDAFAATTSFTANWLMARRKIESWILWITADVVYIGLFGYKELYLSCGIYIVFLIMAVVGLLEWRQKSISMASR
jgi:nicotinamide mononucleotide transporter